ncbi:hypothetical protein NUW58_g5836 [Xylaria curta]|uniref:Uncharacterized protein n=1 Tax=Xylaria curta TaxID=42375 RepID=A0ACC1NZP0_9PEZI|nr:hypothetical protein NUW58_g5836 [Xylaria curta]
MDASYLSQQVNNIIGQLHGLFDEIGVPGHDRDSREAELFAALSETLNNQVKVVTGEKEGMVDEAERIITLIRQMESSLDDSKTQRSPEDDDLQVTYPLIECLKVLKEKHTQISRLHRERFEQVKKLVQALESYSSHLEPTFVKIALPPTGPKQSLPPTFDLSPTYVDKLDDEFTRVYEEYTRRVAIPQTDGAIVKYYRDAPEQLGLHENDLSRLRTKRDKLAEEKKSREKRLKDLKVAVDALWEKLGVDESERKSFLNRNRGCGIRQINEFEDELARLNELKRQNLHLFVEDARFKLQELWDALFFSEDEMLEFTPAFSDVYSDALLEAHESEVSRLEALKEQRAPVLALVERHRTLVHDRDELAASSQDASRLMTRGQKGERRDPGKLLREEKMRKRIAKELPKVEADLTKLLAKWEDDYSRPRAKTPAGPKAALPNRANSVASRAATITRSKTPTANPTGTVRKAAAPSQAAKDPKASPSRIPARAPLSNLKHGNNSPERARPETRAQNTLRPGHPLTRAPPPKMRELVPPPQLETPINPYRGVGLGSGSHVRAVEPDDVYDDHGSQQNYGRSYMHQASHTSLRNERTAYPHAPPPRQTSNTSTAISGSENWETYDDNSEPEHDVSDAYYAKVRAARSKRFTPEDGYGNPQNSQAKRHRGLPPAIHNGQVTVDAEGNRIISGSEWTDEDAF